MRLISGAETPGRELQNRDENNINYDVYEVTLAKGDNITFSASGETAIITVTGADGATATYEGISCSGDDLPE